MTNTTMEWIEEVTTAIKSVLEPQLALTFVILSLGFSVYRWNASRVKVPTYGSEIPVLSLISALRLMERTNEILTDGYKKYPIFKIPTIDRWIVVVSGKYTDELHRAPDDVLSFLEALRVATKSDYTLGKALTNNPWHINTIRGPLVRNLPNVLGDIQEETGPAFEDELALDGDEWREVRVAPAIRRIVSRVSNRVYVGSSLCRNPEWRDLNVDYTTIAMKGAMFMSLFPSFVQPLIGMCLSNVKNSQKKAGRLLIPIIEERYRLPLEERPNDLLSWLMEDAVGEERDPRNLTLRMLLINFASIQNSSVAFTFALYKLLAHPEYIQPLREEVESIVKEEGWTKASMFKMRKLDSFLREVQRMDTFFLVTMERKALKDFTFSDGTFIPRGTHVGVAALPIHMDEKIYEDPSTFKPFRFAETHEGVDDEKDAIMNQMVTTNSQYVIFGHGRHACPGRFLAVTELKCLMGHVLLNYDFKWSNHDFLEAGHTPPNQAFSIFTAPNEDATIMFRRKLRV